MGLEVGELYVELDARTGEFNRALARVDRRLGRFEGQATKSATRASRSFLGVAKSISFVTAAVTGLGAALAALGLAKFTSGAVRAAADYEALGVRLEVLTGNAEGAAKTLDEVNRLVTATPFGLQELGNAAASVAVVFGENTEAVSEFTGIAADLASAFGRPVEQIGENLTRAFSSGLGAADAFREAGISAEILKITGETDVAKISTEQLGEALRAITSEGGKAFLAADKLAKTLTGSLSNSAIAFENFQRAFGEALAPEVVEFALGVWIPLFEDLQSAVIANQDQIRAFAADVIRGLSTAFLNALKFTRGLISGLKLLVDQWNAVKAGVALALVPLQLMIATLKTLVEVAVRSAKVIGLAGKAIGKALTGDFAGARQALAQTTHAWDGFQADFVENAVSVIFAASEASEAIDTFIAGPQTPILDGVISGLDAAILRFDGLTDAAKRAERELSGEGSGSGFLERLQAPIDFSQFGKPTKGGKAEKSEAEKFADEFSSSLSSALAEGIQDGNLLEAVTGVFETATTDGLTKAFDTALDFLGGGLAKLFEGAGLGEGFGSALAGGIGAGLGILTGALKGTKATSSTSVSSAVTSSQAVRGIVAGPTSIPIFEVGRGIGEAIEPLADATREQTRILRDILAAVRSSGGAGVGGLDSEAASILQTTSPALA